MTNVVIIGGIVTVVVAPVVVVIPGVVPTTRNVSYANIIHTWRIKCVYGS